MPYIKFQELEQMDTSFDDSSVVKWTSVASSDTGLVRKVNEDAFLNSSRLGLWAVADGMGGLARGDYASGLVVDALVHFEPTESLANDIRELELRLRQAHANCRGSFKGERVGSTVAALYSHQQYAFFLWAGDSRVYRLRDGEIEPMTVDHTRGQERFAKGELTASQLEKHPSAHVLTRAVGVHQTLHLDLDYATVQNKDRYLICTDGLYNRMSLEDIGSLLEKDCAEEALAAFIEKANGQGGDDNITAIIVDAEVTSQV